MGRSVDRIRSHRAGAAERRARAVAAASCVLRLELLRARNHRIYSGYTGPASALSSRRGRQPTRPVTPFFAALDRAQCPGKPREPGIHSVDDDDHAKNEEPTAKAGSSWEEACTSDPSLPSILSWLAG
jgi:hypothetical protein